ncbi:MAG: sulfatase-like hydrolase/transferase, partial [Cyclobacteriaceae bacterium]
NIDWNVGRIMQALEESGLEENTIVIYLSDNGPNSWRWNGGMKGRKGATDEGGVRSPLLMQWKGTLEAGKKVDEISSVLDLFPTLTDLAGVPVEQEKPLDGQSLKSLLLGEATDWPDRLLVSHWGKRTSVRSRQYRLDHEGQLFDMIADPGQYNNVADKHPEVLARLTAAKKAFEQDALAELPAEDTRPFIVGHPDYPYYQLPARDALAYGTIQRSSRWPNCSFFENWTSTNDSISWEIEVPEAGDYEVEVYYTCQPGDVGTQLQLSFLDQKHRFTVSEAHDPPLKGEAENRVPGDESYVKDFKPLHTGIMQLPAGKGNLTLKALEIPGDEAIDFRLIMLKRLRAGIP